MAPALTLLSSPCSTAELGFPLYSKFMCRLAVTDVSCLQSSGTELQLISIHTLLLYAGYLYRNHLSPLRRPADVARLECIPHADQQNHH